MDRKTIFLISGLVLILLSSNLSLANNEIEHNIEETRELGGRTYETFEFELNRSGTLDLDVKTLEGSMGRLKIDIFLLEPLDLEKFEEGKEFNNITYGKNIEELDIKEDLKGGTYYLLVVNDNSFFRTEVEITGSLIYRDLEDDESDKTGPKSIDLDHLNPYLQKLCFSSISVILILLVIWVVYGIKKKVGD